MDAVEIDSGLTIVVDGYIFNSYTISIRHIADTKSVFCNFSKKRKIWVGNVLVQCPKKQYLCSGF